MLNRSIGIAPVNSFYEPCTISVLIDATVHGSSYVFKEPQLNSYFIGNEYVYREWTHSLMIFIYFSFNPKYTDVNLHVPRRLFYHSVDCGHPDIFPNEVFVPNPLPNLRKINDLTYSIHYRQLPLPMRRSLSAPKYAWDNHAPNIKPGHCLASRWDELSQILDCPPTRIAVHHYQLLLNFTTVARDRIYVQNYGELHTNVVSRAANGSISFHAVDSSNSRVLYCDRKSDSPNLRPISLLSPLSFQACSWEITN
jgi:hypothetical protein